MTSILVLTPHLNDNSLGRTHVWWMLARELGWSVKVVSFEGEQVWRPLRDSEFSTDCTRLRGRTLAGRAIRLSRIAREYDAVVAIKPLPRSLGIALHARRLSRFPLIVDIDDPDLEARLHGPRIIRRALWRARYPAFWMAVRRFRRLERTAAIAVSNPILADMYGGMLLPHARSDPGPTPPHTSTEPRVGFIGTVRWHKGIEILRQAISQLATDGYRLIVTAPPPADAMPWEEWVGEGSVSQGESILESCDIVALPSLPQSFAAGQLPAKLIDAMIRSRCVIVSDIQPMPWAVGNRDLVFPPGSADALARSLAALQDPAIRQQHANQLRTRALSRFSVQQVAPTLNSLLQDATRKMTPQSSNTLD